MATGTQRAFRAACPGCGAPVEFRGAQSIYAICSYCHSTVVREGELLSRVGKMAELFDDHSPLQLMAAGRHQGKAFTLVGRLQYRSGSGTWTEWEALFDDGTQGVLAEDNGAYVFAFSSSFQRAVPPPEQFRVGNTTAVSGKTFTITSNEQAALIAAQGELPKLPALGQPFAMVELRSDEGVVIAIDYGAQPPAVTRGREVRLDDLQMSGLREDSDKQLGNARQFACPHCGAPVQPVLPDSKSITCRSCNSLIDLTSGVGGEFRHAVQDEPVQPLIPLGSIGQLQGVHWQVVGFQHRVGHEPGDDEHFGWSEYLLYQRKRGFIFLVDSEEGWSIVKPTTGSPTYLPNAQTASYLGTKYQLKYSYEAETSYVAGEFYWPVVRGSKTFNRDFARGTSVLSLEETPREQTWSSGTTIDSDTVAKAFKLDGKKDLLQRGDAGPVSSGGASGCLTMLVLMLVILLFLLLLRACMTNDEEGGSSGSGWRSGGGSYGGYSSGGSHK